MILSKILKLLNLATLETAAPEAAGVVADVVVAAVVLDVDVVYLAVPDAASVEKIAAGSNPRTSDESGMKVAAATVSAVVVEYDMKVTPARASLIALALTIAVVKQSLVPRLIVHSELN